MVAGGQGGGGGRGARGITGRGKPLFVGNFPLPYLPPLHPALAPWPGVCRLQVELARCARWCLPVAAMATQEQGRQCRAAARLSSSPAAATSPTWPAPRCRPLCRPSPPPPNRPLFLTQPPRTPTSLKMGKQAPPALAASLKLAHSPPTPSHPHPLLYPTPPRPGPPGVAPPPSATSCLHSVACSVAAQQTHSFVLSGPLQKRRGGFSSPRQ